MIHGGIKYTLSGALNKASETIADMPDYWQRCLGGQGDVDLTQTRCPRQVYQSQVKLIEESPRNYAQHWILSIFVLWIILSLGLTRLRHLQSEGSCRASTQLSFQY